FQSSGENNLNAEIIENEIITAKPNSAVASQPCPSGHITADKREIKKNSQNCLRQLLLSANL
ncbi:MAG: hypothetical protein Q7J55_06085, partial [bacterium]|nr:hypothetical protein [bacterium]